jgi:hypothetical protein
MTLLLIYLVVLLLRVHQTSSLYLLISQHKIMCLIIILTIEIEGMAIMLSDLCRRDVKDITVDHY